MAFTLGSFTADSTLAHVGVLGGVATNSTSLPTSEFAELVLDSTLNPAGELGEAQIGAWISTTLTWGPSGGIALGGGANIIGDPWIPVGGVILGGAVTPGGWSVLWSQNYPRGGVTLGGAAPNAANWIQYNPSGGVTLGGAAAVSSLSVVHFTQSPTGGMTLGGTAYVPSGVALGGGAYYPSGLALSGAAPVQLISPLIYTPAGGLTLGGSAGGALQTTYTPSAGVTLGGSAPNSYNWSLFVSGGGGVALGGSAAAYFLPAGFVASTANPYNDFYSGWAINYESSAPSRYESFPMNAVCTFNGKVYVTNRGGVYQYGADNDDGVAIHASTTLPQTDMENAHNKRVPVVYVGVRAAGAMRLRAQTNKSMEHDYAVDATPSGLSVTHGSRTTIGRGMEGRYWQFSVYNVQGADFELGSIEFTPTILKRHGV